MYIILYKKKIYTTDKLTQKDYDSANKKKITIISTFPPNPVQYREGEWCGINRWVQK